VKKAGNGIKELYRNLAGYILLQGSDIFLDRKFRHRGMLKKEFIISFRLVYLYLNIFRLHSNDIRRNPNLFLM
jgi:hypothetical protein